MSSRPPFVLASALVLWVSCRTTTAVAPAPPPPRGASGAVAQPASGELAPSIVADDEPPADVRRVTQADASTARGRWREALGVLGDATGPSAALVRARALRGQGELELAVNALAATARDPELATLSEIERGLLAHAAREERRAVELLLPVVRSGSPAAAVAVDALAASLVEVSPQTLVEEFGVLEAARSREDPDARSRLLGAKIEALRRLGRLAEARLVETQRYLEEPVSSLTPDKPPPDVTLTAAERLARIERLLAANRNERVVAALDELTEDGLTAAERCQRRLGLGVALRKLREYARAEAELVGAMAACEGDEERRRRAHYLAAKVVSIRDGLRAIPLIEDFAARYREHSMVDDVLFWAGDLYQRRGKLDEARAYYRRIAALSAEGDHCLEARWRLAWMSYRSGDYAAARRGLEALLGASSCPAGAFDASRAHYWCGRIAEDEGDREAAAAAFRQVLAEDAAGYYAQLALARLGVLAYKAVPTPPLPPPSAVGPPSGCDEVLAAHPGFARAERLLARGLATDAARELLAIGLAAQDVLASTHASALGLDAKPAQSAAGGARCDRELRLYLALLLDRAGAYKDAHWRLRTDFARELDRLPSAETAAIWRAAYPLAWRDELGAAERKSGLPELLLQALAREESAFDPSIVSWAGAYGLTQLLVSTGREAARLLDEKVKLERGEDLLDPALNARLGGAFLAALLKRYRGNVALALAAYNAGTDTATLWWKRHAGDGLDVLSEEMTIQETRGYVKRVLRTYGIYRWLYRSEPPALANALTPPAPSR